MRKIYIVFFCMIVASCSKTVLVEPNLPVIVPNKVSVIINSDINVTVIPTGKVDLIKGTNLKVTVLPKPGYTAIISTGGSSFPLVGDTYEMVKVSSDDVLNITSKKDEIVSVFNRTDTIKSAPWHSKAMDVWKGDKWVTDFPLSEKELRASYYFDEPSYPGKLRGYYEDGTLILSCTWEWTGSNSIKIGSEACTYTMTNNLLVIYKESANGNKYRDTFWR